VPLLSEEYDCVVGVFVFNYLSVAETKRSFKEVYRLLKPGGKFVFCVPHPAFPFIRTEREKPFYFEFDKDGYFKSRDQIQNGKIWKLNGDQLTVQMHHKLLEDFMDALRDAQFAKMPHVKELGVTSELAATNPQFFNPIAGVPLHMLMVVEK
jgi:SAM-dependent methyltransferase